MGASEDVERRSSEVQDAMQKRDACDTERTIDDIRIGERERRAHMIRRTGRTRRDRREKRSSEQEECMELGGCRSAGCKCDTSARGEQNVVLLSTQITRPRKRFTVRAKTPNRSDKPNLRLYY